MLLKNICTIVNGSTPSTSNSEYWDGNISWITPKDMSLQMKRYIYLKEKEILPRKVTVLAQQHLFLKTQSY